MSPSPVKIEQNTRMRALRDEGLSLRKISMQLWREGFRNADGDPISAQRISRKLKELEME
jgi:DNA-binding transcriptional MerR regulator